MALRHQVASTEAVKLLNGKPSSRICNSEYTVENGKRFIGIRVSHSECRTNLIMPGGKIKSGCSTLKIKQPLMANKGEEILLATSKGNTVDHENEDLKNGHLDGDVLLQWGQRKRQRNGRFVFKTFALPLPEKSTKTVRNLGMIEKHDRFLPADVSRPNRAPIPRPCNTPVRQTSCANRSRNVNMSSLRGSANHFRTHNVGNDVSGSEDKAQVREISPSSEKAAAAANHTRTASGSSFAVNAQSGADAEAHQGIPPVSENVNLQSIEWPKFVIPLSRKEKEDDFLAIKGSKLPQRPKKRPKHVEKALQHITPGMWLPDLTKERYEVRETEAVENIPRGLKSMCSSDIDSE